MCPSSTSNSNITPGSWRRLRHLGLGVLVLLIGLELFFRLPLTWGLESYEDMLWYDYHPAIYTHDLRDGMHHTLWMFGSSYMMTSLNPALMHEVLTALGQEQITLQNYGLNGLRNLEVMGEVFDRWLFQLDEPTYAVLAVASGNFEIIPRDTQLISSSTLEKMLIFPDSLEEGSAGFLYRNSALFRNSLWLRYLVDQRNVVSYRNNFINQPHPLGGYIERTDTYIPENCDLNTFDVPLNNTLAASSVQDLRQIPAPIPVEEMETFIQLIKRRGIELAVIIIPDQACDIATIYGNYANYRAMFVEPLITYLAAEDVPTLDMPRLFTEAIPAADQADYYNDLKHTNVEGAALFSQWAGEFVADWLNELSGDQAGDAG